MDMTKQPLPQGYPGQPQPYNQQPYSAPYPPPNMYPQPPPTYESAQFSHPYDNQNAFNPQQLPPREAVIVEQPVQIIVSPQVGPEPSTITCPSCKVTMVTRVEYETVSKTHIFAGLLCLFGCWCCVCVPYCMDSCKNGNHYCSNCGSYIGSYNA